MEHAVRSGTETCRMELKMSLDALIEANHAKRYHAYQAV